MKCFWGIAKHGWMFVAWAFVACLFEGLVKYKFHCLNPQIGCQKPLQLLGELSLSLLKSHISLGAITWKLPINRVSLGFCHSICRGLRAGPAPEEPQDPRAGPGGVRLRQGRPGQCGAEARDGDLTSEKWWLNQRKMVTQPDLTSEKVGLNDPKWGVDWFDHQKWWLNHPTWINMGIVDHQPWYRISQATAGASLRPGGAWASKAGFFYATGGCWKWLMGQQLLLVGALEHFLVGGLEHFLFSHILGIIIPID